MDLHIKCAEEQLCLTKKRLNEISPECGSPIPFFLPVNSAKSTAFPHAGTVA